MKQVRRWDAGAVGKVERTDQGYLRAPATITKTGVFTYRQSDGGARRELRLPSEVFNVDAMRSFGLAPLTNGHPPVMLDSRNTARYQVGSVVEPRQDGDHVAAYVQVTDADAIEAAEQGRRQLSCGYTCALEVKSGVTKGVAGIPDGLHFDAIQRNIRGNHVALVDKARAGSTVQLRLDGADGFQVDDEKPIEPQPGAEAAAGRSNQTGDRVDGRPAQETTTMKDIRIDGVTFEASPQVAEAVGKKLAELDAAKTQLAEATKKASEQQARADAAEENLEAEKKARADALSPDKVRAAVDARLALERQASPILGDEVKVDGMTDAEIKRAVVLAVAKDAEVAKQRLDAGDETYLAARYDAAVDAWQPPEQTNEGLKAVRTAGKDAAGRTDSADDARKRMMDFNQRLGRDPIRKGA
jgi:hypothetical protein